MATTQRGSPPNATDEKPQNPGAETVQPTNSNQQNAGEDSIKQTSPTSVFVNSQPMREEQVQNAVKFLSHPKVRSSPVMYRRSFLERKGLTKEEIDEAFQRVPDPPPSVQTTGVNQDGQLKQAPNVQQVQPQSLQPSASAATGTTTALGTLSRSRFHWSHALIAIGLLAASGAGTAVLIKKSILPRLKSWIRKVILEEDNDQLKRTGLKPTLAEEAAQAAKAAAAAAADVAKASQEMLTSKNDERRYFEEFANLLNKQVQEMKTMTNALRGLEGQTVASRGVYLSEQDNRLYEQGQTMVSRGAYISEQDNRLTRTSSKQPVLNGKVDYDSHSVRSSSPPASVEPSNAPHPKSYMEIMAMVQRGEKPSNIRDIDDSPPNPNQQISNPRLIPRSKPWEDSQVQSTATQVLHAKGEELIYKVQDPTLSNGDTAVPWWQKKNVRIQEIDNGNGYNGVTYGAPSSQQPVQRVWVPPQPPPVAMPEAAEAIRRPKPVVQKEQAPDDQPPAHSAEVSDEVLTNPKISESEGATGASSVSSQPIYGEIHEEQ